MSARSKARKHALDILYESDIRGALAESILENRALPEDGPDARPLRDFTKALVLGVTSNKRKIDELITTYAQGWDMDRLASVDRNILRIGIFEIVWSDELEDGIAIDEALTMARDISTEDSSAFIHGLLGKIASIKGSVAR